MRVKYDAELQHVDLPHFRSQYIVYVLLGLLAVDTVF